MPKSSCLYFFGCSKKRKSKESKRAQNDDSPEQSYDKDERGGHHDRRGKKHKGSTKEMVPLKDSHDETRNYPDSLQSAEAEINKLTRQLDPERKSREETLLSLQSAEAEINKLTRQLDSERKSKEEALRLKKELEESENEKAALKINHKEEMGVLRNELRDLRESRTKEQKQVQHHVASTELKGKGEDYEILKKKLEESEREIEKWKNQYNSLVQEKRIIEEETQSSRSAEAKINQLTIQLEKERKDSEAAHLRKSEEYMKEKSTIKQTYQEEFQKLQQEIQRLKESQVQEKRTVEEETQSSRSAEAKINQLTIQLEKERKDSEAALLRKSEEYMKEKSTLKQTYQDEFQKLQQEIQTLKERLENNKSSFEKREKELKTKCDELKAEITSYKESWTKSENAKIQLEMKIAELENKLKEVERDNKKWNNQYNSLGEEKRRTEEELERLEAKINQLTNQLDSERKAKEDALLRLSSMASNKLRDNNPNIADLSDPNRPTKLSEQFSELYDNEWTDAFDELEKLLGDKQDKEIISYLKDFVLEIHSVCTNISSSKMKTIEEAFVKPSVPSEKNKIPTEIFKTIKDGIKSMAPKLLEQTREHVLGHLEEKYLTDPVSGCLQHQSIKRYIDKCTEVCWYMSVQDPQLVMDGSESPERKFDSNKHREYTKKGPYEEFVVWPALYLYRGGQMLSKGVAQGGKQ